MIFAKLVATQRRTAHDGDPFAKIDRPRRHIVMAVEWDRGLNRISKFLSFVVVRVIHSQFIRIHRVTDNPDTYLDLRSRKNLSKSSLRTSDIFVPSIIIFLIKRQCLTLRFSRQTYKYERAI